MTSDNTNPFLRAIRSRLILIVIVLGLASEARAQLLVNESVTPSQAQALVEDLLVGSCVSVSNVSFTGYANGVNMGAVGSFSQGSTTNIGLEEGVLITTGRASNAIGPNTTAFVALSNGTGGDSDLTSIVGLTTYDAAILEFDFVPLTDTLRFRYTFGSDEYSEYVNLGFNDVFGFFLSGPGYAGPFLNGAENIALIPNTSTYVAIDNVNNGNAGFGPGLGPCTNCAYYVENHGGSTIQYDGFTVVLTALAVVQPCQTYHMKFAIADAGDDAVDSGVFLGARSFSAGESVDVSVTANAPLNEGCTSGLFTFTRLDPSTLAQELVVQFTLSGTASAGVDFASIPNSFTIPAGQMSASLDISALLDYTTEGDESITITVTNTQCSCVPAAPVTATATIQDKDTPLSVNSAGTITICEGQSATLSATPVGSLGPYQVEWDNGAGLGYSVDVTPSTTTTYTVTVVDACGTQQVSSQETVTVVLANFDVNTAAQCISDNLFNFTNMGGSGAGVSHHWDFDDGNSSTDENPSHSFASAGNYTVTHTVTWLASGCQAAFTTDVEVFSQPVATASTVQDVFCAQLGEVTVNVTGGEAPFQYLWSTGATTATVNGLSANTYTVTVTDDNGCTGQSQTTVADITGPGPVAVCQDITVQLNASGNATIFATQVDNGSSDDCGIASLLVSPASFNCSNIGANTVTLTVQNVLGASATCTATVTVQDNVAPTALCQNITVQLDASGNASITAAQVNNGSTDNCGIQSLAVSPNTFTCTDIGANTVTLTVTDVNGNVSTCNATVTVEDNIAPNAFCGNLTVQLDASGNASITAAQVNDESSENCGIQSLAVSPNTFTCANVGANTVILTVTDVNGNMSTCNATVTVQDNIAPTATCQNITVQLDGSGNASITAAQIDNGSSDNCGIQSLAVSPNTFTCADIGTNSVTLTVTDVNGNVSTCNSTVTVEGGNGLTALCQNVTVQLNASGNASISASDIDAGSSSDCGIQSITLSPNTFSCADIGTNSVTLTVTDVNGNVATCDATVTVQDITPPTALCQNITVQLDASGNASITAAQINNGSSDNCGIQSIIVSPNAFTCADIGANTVTLTVTDVNGNVSTCNATVTVQDNFAPAALCQNITVQLDAIGNASITAAQIDNGSSDNCAVQSVSVSPSTFTCADIGANTVTLSVTDVNGNTGTCDATVTVQDNLAPNALCQNITVQLDANGNASITAAQIDNGSSDNCGIQSLAVSPNTFTCADIGTNSVTLTVTDVNGNVSTCNATVTVQDNTPPTAVCQNITVQLDAVGTASITVAQINNGSSDNCGIQSITVSPNAFTCADIGANTVTLTVTDVNGNVSTCNATVTVQDNIAPTTLCQNITVQLDASGNASITAAQINNGSTDNCGIQSVTVSPNSFTCADIGTNSVTLTVTDVNGNVSTCNATVIVQDNIAPTALCQNITVQLDASGNASITAAQINNGSSDNCGIQSVTVSPNTFTCADIGTNTMTLTVTDVNGNVSTCNATVTVQDNIAPTALCLNITVQVGGSGGMTVAPLEIDNGSLDNCGITSMILTPNTFTCAQVGPNNVTLQVADASGNTASCNAVVTVQTVSGLVALCRNITVQLDAGGNATITAADIDNGSGADCGSVDIAIDRTTFTCADLGPNTVTLTASDAFGNSETCTATVTVQDAINPTAICQNITVQLDASGNVSITAAQINNGSSDNCGIQSITVSPNTFTCTNVGANTVTLTVTDVNGNVSTCNATVTVQDNIAPTALCQNITVQLDASGNASITAAQINNGSTDNCGIQSVTVSPNTFTCADIGTNSVTLTVTDVNGNVSTCNATVTVQDNIAPTAVCQNITVQVGGAGSISVNPAQVDNGSSDNCSGFTMSLSPNSFTCANAGPNQVTLTVTDASGNTASCDATVTVEVVVADVIALCQDITVPLDADGNASISASDIDNGSGANCGTVNLFLNRSAFSCVDLGPNNVTLTASDGLGGTATCTSVVTVLDVIPPVSICQNIMVLVDGSGSTSITASDINNGSFDNCAITSMTVSPNSFTCDDIGLNTVTLTVTDANGNSSFCNAIVTVNVTSGVSALCQNATVQLDANGTATITAATIDNGSGADCGTFDIAIDRSSFSCSDLGANTVTLTVSNASGSSETCQSTVTVLDNIPPTALCQNVTIQITGADIITVTPQEVDNGSSDNCAITSMTLSPNTFSCEDIGENPVTLTVVDASGNSSSCTAIISVLVISGLVAECQDINVYLDANGAASITANDVNNGSGAGCGDVSLAIDRSTFSCSDLGANIVTLTVTDEFGEAATCISTVTVLDTVSPVFTSCPADQTVQVADGVCSAVVIWDSPVAVDNCAVTITSSHNSGDTFPIGITTVTLTATDASGNSALCTFEIEVTGGAPLSAEVVVLERACGHAISCHSLSDGQAEVMISGGCAPYSILWSTGVTTPQVGNLSADLYNVTVTDASGTSVVVDFGLSQPEPLSLSSPDLSSYIGGLNISCKAANDGFIAISAQGGADCVPYDANWTGPNGFTSTDLSINGLTSGTYSLVIEDANGCEVNTSITLTEPDALGLVLSDVINVSCAGAADGSASVNAFGGTEPYTLAFENGDPVVSLIGLSADLYTITLTDVNGCVAVQTITITEPLPLSVDVEDVTDASCFGISDGEAELEVLGGTSPFSVIWEGGQSGLQVTGLAVGQNTFNVTDANGCTLMDSVEVGSPLELVIDTIVVTGVSCLGGSDGTALATVVGGQAPYNYAWSPAGQVGNPGTQLPAGNLLLTVTDDNGCFVTQPFIVTQPPGLSISASADTSICAGSAVVVSALASGGANGFIYSWDNGLGNGAQHLVNPTTPTSYIVTATDANGCSISETVNIAINPSPQAAFTASVIDPCVLPFQFTTTNNSAGATNYLWYQGTTIIEENAPVVSYDSPGMYTLALVAVSENGCTDSVTTVLQVQAPPVANFIISDQEGCLPVGTVFTSTSTGGQTYSWNFGDGQTGSGASAGHSYFLVGSYDVTLTVTSSLGCLSTFSVDDAVTVHPIPTANFSILDLGTGVGGNYQFVNSSTGGTSYAWQFGEGGFSDEVSPIYSYDANGGFDVTLTVINEFGCVDTARSSLSVELARGLFVPNAMVIGNTEGAGVFRPTGVGLMEYRALIFDKWGNQLWESTELVGGSPAGEWDGRYRGELVPQGAYVWYVEARFQDGTVWDGMDGPDGSLRQNGSITVMY